ncbi:MAG: hypothetical protein K2K78_01405 [Muribaculaceae bacterium]|nr:hypothetical protein [Muribaculaceae bacterium]
MNSKDLIQRLCMEYMAGGTSRDEERHLSALILAAEKERELTDLEADCLMLLAVGAARRKKANVAVLRMRRLMSVGAAAAVAAVLGAGIIRFVPTFAGDATHEMCYACVLGSVIDDRDTVMSIINNELSDAAGVVGDFSAFVDEEFIEACEVIERTQVSFDSRMEELPDAGALIR